MFNSAMNYKHSITLFDWKIILILASLRIGSSLYNKYVLLMAVSYAIELLFLRNYVSNIFPK